MQHTPMKRDSRLPDVLPELIQAITLVQLVQILGGVVSDNDIQPSPQLPHPILDWKSIGRAADERAVSPSCDLLIYLT